MASHSSQNSRLTSMLASGRAKGNKMGEPCPQKLSKNPSADRIIQVLKLKRTEISQTFVPIGVISVNQRPTLQETL
jgi:hypothetical protein